MTTYIVTVSDEASELFEALFNTRIVDEVDPEATLLEYGPEKCPECGEEDTSVEPSSMMPGCRAPSSPVRAPTGPLSRGPGCRE